jgi:RNA polymerase sigma-70 factor (ECF subfamily)
LHTDNKVSPYQLSDEVLIARVAQGDKTALEILYDRYAPTVLGICLKVIGNHATAEDVLQETFWQVWQSADSYPSQPRSFTGWLFKIARERAKEIVTKIE